MAAGKTFSLGATGGSREVTLTTAQIPGIPIMAVPRAMEHTPIQPRQAQLAGTAIISTRKETL